MLLARQFARVAARLNLMYITLINFHQRDLSSTLLVFLFQAFGHTVTEFLFRSKAVRKKRSTLVVFYF